MTITRADVADLREGDVVEYHREDWPTGVYIRGPLHRGSGRWIGLRDCVIRYDDGDINGYAMLDGTTLTVVSRAPRRLYVNHDRTEPVPGDVVRDADVDEAPVTYHYLGGARGGGNVVGDWWSSGDLLRTGKLPARLRLLVDGETGKPPRGSSTVRVGDLWDGPEDVEHYCSGRSNGLLCCLPDGHPLPHIAGDGTHALAVWS